MTAALAPMLSTTEAAEAADVTFRMADYWVRHGVMRPIQPAEGSGKPRRWSVEDVYVLSVVAQVAEAVSPTSCHASTEVLGLVAEAARAHYRTVGSRFHPLRLVLAAGVALVIDPEARA